MKNIKFLNVVFLFLVATTAFSCNDSKDDTNATIDLIGEWQRSDANKEFEYKITFNTNNTGTKTQREGDIDGQAISSISTFNWSINGDKITLDFDGDIVVTKFYITVNGQLHLTDLTELHFIKL